MAKKKMPKDSVNETKSSKLKTSEGKNNKKAKANTQATDVKKVKSNTNTQATDVKKVKSNTNTQATDAKKVKPKTNTQATDAKKVKAKTNTQATDVKKANAKLTKEEKALEKAQNEIERKTIRLYAGLDRLQAREFKGVFDRLVNAFFSVAATAAVVLFSIFVLPTIDLNALANKLFDTAEGILSTLGTWGVVIATFVLSTFLSRTKIKLPKFLKKITVRPGLVASVTVLSALPVACSNGTISNEIMIVLAYGLIFYSCFASRSNLYHLFINRFAIGVDRKLDGVDKLLAGNTLDAKGAENALDSFVKMLGGVSGKSGKAARTSTLIITFVSAAITAAWVYFVNANTYPVSIISAIAALSLTTVTELVEAFKGPNSKKEGVDISKERIETLYNEVKKIAEAVEVKA